MADLTGQQFGNYRLIRHLGTGGFGAVYLGMHVHLRREAAIKILLKLDEREIEQFRREAQIIARLVHPHIVTLFDYDVMAGTPFLVMMYAEQGTMRERYRRGTRAPLAEVTEYIIQAAQGLQFAHDQHVLHRDVKPANMLLGPRGELLLSDFGVAVMWSGTRSISTQNASGTHVYMAPEQYRGHPRPASDQYALAITAYEWLSGARPMADSPLGLGMLQMTRPEVQAPPLRRVIPLLPSRVDDVLRRALASDWQARFPSIAVFAEELARAASRDPGIHTRSSALTRPALSSPSMPPLYLTGQTRTPSETARRVMPDTQPSTAPTHRPSETTPPPLPQRNALTPPPPPPDAGYPAYAPPPPPPNTPIQYPLPVTPRQAPVSLVPAKTRIPRPLVLPVTRAGNARLTWTWTIGYTLFLLFLSIPLLVLSEVYATATPTWVFVVVGIDLTFLALSGTVLCGALLGKWRGGLISLLMAGLVLAGIYLLHPGDLASPASDWKNFFYYLVIPISSFITGWIYERRRYANFGKNFLSMLAGTALLLGPLLIASVVTSTTTSSSSTALSPAMEYLATVWCMLILFIFPLALLAAGLAALLQKMVGRGVQQSR